MGSELAILTWGAPKSALICLGSQGKCLCARGGRGVLLKAGGEDRVGRVTVACVMVCVTVTTACSGTSAAPDGGRVESDVAVSRATLIHVDDEHVLLMNVLSAQQDRLTSVSVDGAESTRFALYRSFEPSDVASGSPSELPIPIPLSPVEAVDLDAHKVVEFGWDGYGAVLKGKGAIQPKATTVDVTLEFDKGAPIHVAVPVVQQ